MPSELPPPAAEDLAINIDPPTREETAEAIAAMKRNKVTALDCAITAEQLQGGSDQMLDVIHAFCSDVYTSLSPHVSGLPMLSSRYPRKVMSH